MGLQATNAGIDFQQRVSAYMMILMEFDMDISLALQVNKSNTIKEINFEDCESIDDLVITLDSGKKLYFQMKRTISLSDDAESEFYGVCEQFVKQFLKQNENDLAYILAIRTESSKAISVKLKRILEGIRLANNLEVIDKLNREERTIFGKVSANIKTIYKKYTSKDISEDDLLKLLLRIYVELFDIESGEEYEKTIKLILWNLIEVDVELFWRTFISKAVEYGANRRCLSQENLKEQCKSYFKENKTESNILTEPFWGRVWKEGCKDIEVQIDYVLAIPTQTTREEMSIEEDTIFYFELYRFDDSKKKDSLKYIAPNKMISVISMLSIFFGMWFGFYQIKSTLLEQRFSNRLELADDLMSKYISLSEYASKAAFYLVADANDQAKNFKEYSGCVKKHMEELEKIKSKIAAYGSAELVSLFFDSYNDIQLKIQTRRIDFASCRNYFHSMPLIASCIKYDLTGEEVNPSIFYNSFMKELKKLEEAKGMEKFHETMIITNNKLVKKYNLSNKFIWKEVKE